MSVTADPAQFVIPNVTLGKWATTQELQVNHVDYVLISTKEASAGYGLGSPDFYAWVSAHGRRVFSFNGRTHGELNLYRLDSP